MPTPSLPDPEAQPTFSTCPDADDFARQRTTTNVQEDIDTSPRSDDASSGPHFDNSDGPISDADVDASDSSHGGRAYTESHKAIDIHIDRTDSPCEPSPIESIATPRSRHGVGTGYTSHLNSLPTSRYSQTTGDEMEQDISLPSMGYGYPSRRVCINNAGNTQQEPALVLTLHAQVIPTSPSSFLRAGSRFTGTQRSENHVYDVQVEIKYVDLCESFLCGYLRIQGISCHAQSFYHLHHDCGSTNLSCSAFQV